MANNQTKVKTSDSKVSLYGKPPYQKRLKEYLSSSIKPCPKGFVMESIPIPQAITLIMDIIGQTIWCFGAKLYLSSKKPPNAKKELPKKIPNRFFKIKVPPVKLSVKKRYNKITRKTKATPATKEITKAKI